MNNMENEYKAIIEESARKRRERVDELILSGELNNGLDGGMDKFQDIIEERDRKIKNLFDNGVLM